MRSCPKTNLVRIDFKGGVPIVTPERGLRKSRRDLISRIYTLFTLKFEQT